MVLKERNIMKQLFVLMILITISNAVFAVTTAVKVNNINHYINQQKSKHLQDVADLKLNKLQLEEISRSKNKLTTL